MNDWKGDAIDDIICDLLQNAAITMDGPYPGDAEIKDLPFYQIARKQIKTLVYNTPPPIRNTTVHCLHCGKPFVTGVVVIEKERLDEEDAKDKTM